MATKVGNIRDLYTYANRGNEAIGSGSYGKVYRDVSRSNGKNVAIKVVEKAKALEKELISASRAITRM